MVRRGAGHFLGGRWEYAAVIAHQPYLRVTNNAPMPFTAWFEGCELNFVDQVFRHRHLGGPAIVYDSEASGPGELSWPELERQVACLARTLRELRVCAGDRVVGYLPNIPQTVVAFLAVASIGGIWSVVSPDMGTASVLDRFKQIGPKVLIACDGYRHGGKAYDRRDEFVSLIGELPTVEGVIYVNHLYAETDAPVTGLQALISWQSAILGAGPLRSVPVPGNHPLWILYSSGTTGMPKGIVHGHVGMLVQALVSAWFHADLNPGDRVFWTVSTSWMVWNAHVSALLAGATLVLFDGSPTGAGPTPDWLHLWRLAGRARVNFFGAGAAFFHACLKAHISPRESVDLINLRTVSSTGSPLSTDGYQWLHHSVKEDLWISSASGGTDICGAFVGGVPTLPVYAGEMQCRILGASVESFSEDGRSVMGEVGELVCTRPLPSMPLFFWGDSDNQRYLESYFGEFKGPQNEPIWRHGDWIRLVNRAGAVAAVIYGRSDATVNRHGIRMGTAEFYRVVEAFDEVLDSMVVDLEYLGRDSYMALFVVLGPGLSLTQELKTKMMLAIKAALSPRHVPNEILEVPAIPRTLTGKKMELPIKKLLLGHPVNQVVSPGAMANPQSLDWFVKLAQSR